MNGIIADFLAQHYLTLPFVTRAAGCVSTLSKPGKNKSVTKIPVAMRVFEETPTGPTLCIGDEDYHALTPDSSQAAILYFEDVAGAKVIASNSRYLTWEGRVKLVLWVNFALIGAEFTLGELEASILANTPTELTASGALYGAIITPSKIYPKLPSPFEAYSYDEAQRQYLTAPYGYTSMEITYKARAARGCGANIVLNPVVC